MGAKSRRVVVPPVRTGHEVVRLATAALGPWHASRAAVVVVGLDDANRVAGIAENRRRWSLRAFSSRELVSLANELRARSLVLVQFVPNKRGAPTMADAHDFRTLASRCAADRTLLLDCIVVSGERRWSLARMAVDAARSN